MIFVVAFQLQPVGVIFLNGAKKTYFIMTSIIIYDIMLKQTTLLKRLSMGVLGGFVNIKHPIITN